MIATAISVERIVNKLAELSENGTKAVCLTCELHENSERKNFAHNHSREIGRAARERFPFFGQTWREGCFSLGARGYFWTPRSIIGEKGNLWPAEKDCVNFPLSEV